MDSTRRKLLQLAAVAPVTAGSLMGAAKQQLSNMGMAGYGNKVCGYDMQDAPGKPKIFTDFAKWAIGERDSWRRQARDVHSLDPDIACMHIPLATAIRFQCQRNYERIEAEQKSWFERMLADNGKFEWYQ